MCVINNQCILQLSKRIKTIMKIKIALKTKIFQGQIHKFKIDVLSLKNFKTSIYIIVNILK